VGAYARPEGVLQEFRYRRLPNRNSVQDPQY
jgi:hypothetical protein